MSDHPVLPQFEETVREVVAASDTMDEFDVMSADPESMAQWQALERQYVTHALQLIDLIANEAPRLRAELESLLS
jgi:hypothetical protein